MRSFHRRCRQLFTSLFVPSAVALLILLAQTAAAQQAELEAVLEATETLTATHAEIVELDAEFDNIRRLWGDPWNSPERVRAREIREELSELRERATAERNAYDAAVNRYQAAILPHLELARFALRQHQAIRAASGRPVIKRRAQAAIERDLQRLMGFPLARALEVHEAIGTVLRRTRTDQNIEDLIGHYTKDDPALKEYLTKMWGEASSRIHELRPLERVALWNKTMGHVGAAIQAYGVMTHETDNPFGSTEIEQLIGLIDLSDKLPTGELSFPILSYYLPFLKLAVESILRSAEQINYQIARHNLGQLLIAANERTTDDGDDWLGLRPRSLFGIPGPNPKIYPTNTHYYPGEPITGTWYGSLLYADNAWLGIIDVEARAEILDSYNRSEREGIANSRTQENDRVTAEEEVLNDQVDLAYVHLGSDDTGTFSFAIDLEPGQFVLAMFDSDAGGKRVVEIPITVGCQGIHFRTRKSAYLPTEEVEVEYCGMPGNDDDWLTIVPAGDPDDTYEVWNWARKPSGYAVFGPLEPGSYEARFHYSWDSKGYNVVHRSPFRVEGETEPPQADGDLSWLLGDWRSNDGHAGHNGLVLRFTLDGGKAVGHVIALSSDAEREGYTVGQRVCRDYVNGGESSVWPHHAEGGSCLNSNWFVNKPMDWWAGVIVIRHYDTAGINHPTPNTDYLITPGLPSYGFVKVR